MELEEFDLIRMRTQLIDANHLIEIIVGAQPKSFAYPCGQTFVGKGLNTKSYVPLVAELFTSGRGWLDEVDNVPLRFDPAQVMARRMDGQNFKEIRRLVDAVIQEERWLVLAGHRVGTAGKYRTDANMLRELLSFATLKTPELWIAPVNTVIDHVTEHR